MKKTVSICFLILLVLLPHLLNFDTAQARNTAVSNSEEYYLNSTRATLLIDESMTLSVEGVSDEEISFKSEDSSIVSTGAEKENSCEITGVAVGQTTITAKIKKKGAFFFMNSTTTLRCRVTVTPKAVSIKFKKRKYTLSVGEKRKTSVILRPSITTEVPVFSSSNSDIATVNTKGRVIAHSPGITIITATISNGMTARCKVIITDNTTKNRSTGPSKKS